MPGGAMASDAVTSDVVDAKSVLLSLLRVDGGPGQEAEVAETIIRLACEAGLEAKQFASDSAHKSIGSGERGNLVLKLPGRGMRGPRRMFSAHMDTVPLCVGQEPVVEGDVIRGRHRQFALGGDDRAGCGVLVTMLRRLLQSEVPHPPLTFVWFVQEEVGLRGARHIATGKLGNPAVAYNFDGASPDTLVIGATGDVAIQATIRGRASHAGVAPQDGVSAAAVLAHALAELDRDGWHGLIEKPGGRGSSNLGVVHGGAATNVVMDRLDFRAEVRSHSAAFRKKIVKRWKAAFERAAASVKAKDGHAATIEWDEELKYESFRLAKSADVVKAAERAVRACGRTPQTLVGNGGLDANWLNAHGIPTVTLGCGQRGIHTTAETLDLPDYFAACDVAFELATASA